PTAPPGRLLPATDAQSRTRPAAGQHIPEAAAPPAGGHKDIPVKSQDEAGLTIQALVWSTAPEDRLVVVNGNILKEGGVIGGASVTFIGEDYIIMSQGGSRWKLKFQLK
ncbi:general secretion pathway protein GspB, partial [Desulfococcus sp.]|uniref:general secretion pathway protein GspB n=1 Tax=Desulfococcus sp. TaxID=2025834 RepID=UPI003593E26B